MPVASRIPLRVRCGQLRPTSWWTRWRPATTPRVMVQSPPSTIGTRPARASRSTATAPRAPPPRGCGGRVGGVGPEHPAVHIAGLGHTKPRGPAAGRRTRARAARVGPGPVRRGTRRRSWGPGGPTVSVAPRLHHRLQGLLPGQPIRNTRQPRDHAPPWPGRPAGRPRRNGAVHGSVGWHPDAGPRSTSTIPTPLQNTGVPSSRGRKDGLHLY